MRQLDLAPNITTAWYVDLTHSFTTKTLFDLTILITATCKTDLTTPFATAIFFDLTH